MNESSFQVIIISRDTLLETQQATDASSVFRVLAKLTRKGYHLLLTASEPEQWLPTRGNVDSALAQQGILQEAITSAGGDLDGVYYVPRSLFTQDRNREGALNDILERYSVTPESAVLISSSTPFTKAATRLNIPTFPIASGDNSSEALENVLKALDVA